MRRSVDSFTQVLTHPSCDGLNVKSLPTVALCSHGVELLLILQNLSIDVHQNIVYLLNQCSRHHSSGTHPADSFRVMY